MNLRQIKYFAAVAKESHFSRAAQKLHISQPPLSMSIRQLEDELGFSLFARTNKRVRLTDAGRVFYPEALQLLRQAEEMQRISKRIASGTIGHLRAGLSSSMLFRGLSSMIQSYQRQYPRVDILLRELNSSEQIESLQREQIDVGFVHYQPHEANISAQLFLAEGFVCCLPRHHALASNDTIAVHALRHEAFLLFPRSLSPHYYDKIMAICINAGFSPVITHEVRNWVTVVEAVNQSFGVALVPKSMEKYQRENVVYRAIENDRILSNTYCVWRSDNHSVLLENFLREGISVDQNAADG